MAARELCGKATQIHFYYSVHDLQWGLTYISFFLNFMTLNQQYIFNGKYISNMDLWEIEIYGGMLCHDAEQKESKLSFSALPYASHMFISISTQYCAVCCCLVAMLYEGHCMHF